MQFPISSLVHFPHVIPRLPSIYSSSVAVQKGGSSPIGVNKAWHIKLKLD